MRTRLVVLVVLLLTSYGAIRGFFALQEANRTIATLQTSLQQAQERTERTAAAVQAVTASTSKHRKELEDEYKQFSNWSSATVPSSVSDRLCSFLSCE